MSAEPLTAAEHGALELSGQLANAVRQIIGDGPNAANDWAEAAQHIHVIQHMILSQAGARAYPMRYRLLGEALTLSESPSPQLGQEGNQ